MRNLLSTLAIVCVSMIWSLTNEECATAQDLAATATTTSLSSNANWHKEASQLQSRIGQNVEVDESCCRCARHTGTAYAGLTPGQTYTGLKPNTYDQLTVRQSKPFFNPAKTSRPKAPAAQEVETLVVNGLLQTAIEKNNRQTGWAPPVTPNPECGAGGNCPPLVCEDGHCQHSYAVVFASKGCKHCPKMWPVIEKLRKRGYIVYYFETNKYPSVVKQFDLKVAPTTIIFDKGEQVARFNGVATAPNIMTHMKTRTEQGLK